MLLNEMQHAAQRTSCEVCAPSRKVERPGCWVQARTTRWGWWAQACPGWTVHLQQEQCSQRGVKVAVRTGLVCLVHSHAVAVQPQPVLQQCRHALAQPLLLPLQLCAPAALSLTTQHPEDAGERGPFCRNAYVQPRHSTNDECSNSNTKCDCGDAKAAGGTPMQHRMSAQDRGQENRDTATSWGTVADAFEEV